MKIKIYKRWEHPVLGWLPYIIINCSNITPEEYAQIHAESDYKDCKYEIVEA